MPTMTTAPQIYRPPLLYNGQRLEREEFYRRIDCLIEMGEDPKGIERLEGVVYMPASIRAQQHAEPQGYMVTWLGTYTAMTPGVQLGGNATSKLDLENDPESDAFLRIRPECGGQSRTDRRGFIDGPPELLVEVTGSTTEKDLELKFEVYRRNGVLEYIVWETLAEEFYWFALENSEYVRMTPGVDGLLKSRVFPGLWLDVEALLNGDLARVLAIVQQGITTPEHAEFVERLRQAKSDPA
jgi:Uma2 family endonuclease